jgi:ABC-type nitrate/sulfonate/bicarbonate transport system ATPase subunit
MRIDALLQSVDLADSAQALPGELSGGEVQRISFARAVAQRPQILLADEPTASLDSQTAHDLLRLMLDVVRKERATLIVTTHDPVVIELADRTMHLLPQDWGPPDLTPAHRQAAGRLRQLLLQKADQAGFDQFEQPVAAGPAFLDALPAAGSDRYNGLQ